MKTIESLKRGVTKVRRLWNSKTYDQALTEVERLLADWPNNSQLLIMRADLICLQKDEDGEPTLEDAKSDLELAVKLDEDSPAALIELGYFAYAIEDDAKTASKHFEKAVHRAVDLLTQALVGQAKALAELGHETKASDSLMTACSLVAHYRGSVRDSVLEGIKGLMEDTLEAGSVSTNGTKR